MEAETVDVGVELLRETWEGISMCVLFICVVVIMFRVMKMLEDA